MKSIDGTRIGLTIPGSGAEDGEDGEDLAELLRRSNGSGPKSFGSLGGMFDNLKF